MEGTSVKRIPPIGNKHGKHISDGFEQVQGLEGIKIERANHSIKTPNGIIMTIEDLYPVKSDHAILVTKNASEIAEYLGLSDVSDRLFVAALLHDVMKARARAQMIEREKDLIPLFLAHSGFYAEHGIFVDDGVQGDNSNHWITHAPESAYFAHTELGISDPEILKAIAHHQHGQDASRFHEMTDFEKIIMLADYIDEQEAVYEQLAMQTIRETRSLDLALLVILTGTLQKESIRNDKPDGAIPNGNLVMLWKLLATDYEAENGFSAKLSEVDPQITAYLKAEIPTTKKLAVHYSSRREMNREAFLQTSRQLLQERQQLL